MTIVPCPKCADLVVLPDRASCRATVRCPLCQAQFLLTEVLDKLPPALLVVDDPEAADAALAGAMAPEAWVAPAVRDAEGAGGFVPLSIETEAASGPASGVPRGRRPAARAKRKPKNPVMEGVKIVLGGVAGLAIAQVILWWLGSSQSWPKQRADMFELAPKVGRFAPWIVPERYRGAPPAGDAAGASEQDAGAVAMGSIEDRPPQGLPQRTFVDPGADSSAKSAAKIEPAKAKKSSRSSTKKTPGAAGIDDGFPHDLGGSGASEKPEIAGQVPPSADDPLADLDLDLETMDDRPVADPEVSPVMEPESDTTVEPKPAAEPMPNAPRTTAADLRTAVEEAQTVVEALKATPEADSRPLLRQAYVALAKVGETAAFRSSSDTAALQAASDLLKNVIAEDDKLTTLGRAAGVWLKTSSRDNNGVLLLGTVKEVRQQGGYRVTELVIPGRDGAVAVYRGGEDGDVYPSDTRLVVLGAIITSPDKDLVGYEGDGEPVVWEGLAERLTAP